MKNEPQTIIISFSVELLKQLQSHLPLKDVKTILEGVADGLAAEISIPDGPMPERLDAVVNYMNQQGYGARWEATNAGFLLFVSNCPYYHIASEDNLLCAMDVRMMSHCLKLHLAQSTVYQPVIRHVHM